MTELELLSILLALQKWRYYLLGTKFTIRIYRPNGSRTQFLYYSGHGGPVRPLVSYDDDGNPD